MKGKRILSLVLILAMFFAIVPTALAASDDAVTAANALYELGLFQGTGTNADGTPNFDLDRVPTRNEAVTMLVRLLGKEAEAKSGTWNIPFTDVADWAKPYVGYAYASGLTTGTGATTFGGSAAISASQYITFVLRALGYESGTDFQWDKAWELSDSIGLTNSNYNASTSDFTRGDVAVISYDALSNAKKNSVLTIADELGLKINASVANQLNGRYWVGANGSEDALIIEIYYFEGHTYGCAYQCYDENDEIALYGYETGSFTVTGTNLKLQRAESYVQPASSDESFSVDDTSVLEYEITVESESTMKLNEWSYTSSDGLSMLYEPLKEMIYDNYRGQSSDTAAVTPTAPASADYAYTAGDDFRSIRRQYSQAVAQCAYVYAYVNTNGEVCVLTEVYYKIINNYSLLTLRNMTTGEVIRDPASYYQKKADLFLRRKSVGVYEYCK